MQKFFKFPIRLVFDTLDEAPGAIVLGCFLYGFGMKYVWRKINWDEEYSDLVELEWEKN